MRLAVLLAVCAAASAQTLDRAYEAVRARDYDTAIAGFRKAIEAEPDRAAIRKDLAYTYLKIGENEPAREQFRAAMRLDPRDNAIAMEYAYLCYEAKEQAEARRIFDRIRKTGNATAEQAFQNIDKPLAAAIDRWKAAIGMGAQNFGAHFELARAAEQRDDLALAEEHYGEAWRLEPDRRAVLVDLARVRKALGRGEDATAALLAASRGGEPRAAEMARALLPDRYPYVEEFRSAVALDPRNVELRREMAYLLLRMGRQPDAEREFQLLAEPPLADLLSATQLGFLLEARGEQAAAHVFFDRVLAGKDEDLANRVRAVLHVPQVLQTRASAAPTVVDAKVMAERSIKAGYVKDSLKYLRMAHEADPADAEVMLRMAWAYNILHQDSLAYHWFNQARKSSDPAVAGEADKGWTSLRSANERFRTTAWLYPMFSTRWHDLFGYAQAKTEVRTGLGVHVYLSARFIGDSRQTMGAAMPQYLSESSVIVAGGVATTPWHGILGWGEAGQAISYISGQRRPDYRAGLSFARGAGHTLRGERAGWFADTTADLVYVSRFNNDVLLYHQGRVGFTVGPEALRAQIYGITNGTLDWQRQAWASFGEAGLGLRMTAAFLPESMYFSFDAQRGAYLINKDNPRRPNFYDLRAGFWYAFTR